ncbi:MAG: DNA polymerase III subunit delta [Syntrophomonadaceae bacterium]|nr:DNA polymerase III subunit delta [Syntrophomonadaceae bacterium]
MDDNNTYLLWGPEAYLINQKIDGIVTGLAAAGEPPAVLNIDGDETPPQELGQILDFSPLFAMTRAVIIRNPNWLGKSPRGAKKTEGYRQVLDDYFQRDYPGQVLILTALESHSTNPITKLLQKQARVINIKPLSGAELEKWCRRELEKRQIRVAPAALARIAASGQDMYYLENMFEKLALMQREDVWGAAEIDEHLDSRLEISIFKLTDALLLRNTKASLETFRQLTEQGQPHLVILAMIIQQFVALSKVKFCIDAGYDKASIATATGLKDFVVRKMRDTAANFSSGEIRMVFEKLLEVDTAFKTENKDPRLVMETLLVAICSRG